MASSTVYGINSLPQEVLQNNYSYLPSEDQIFKDRARISRMLNNYIEKDRLVTPISHMVYDLNESKIPLLFNPIRAFPPPPSFSIPKLEFTCTNSSSDSEIVSTQPSGSNWYKIIAIAAGVLAAVCLTISAVALVVLFPPAALTIPPALASFAAASGTQIAITSGCASLLFGAISASCEYLRRRQLSHITDAAK